MAASLSLSQTIHQEDFFYSPDRIAPASTPHSVPEQFTLLTLTPQNIGNKQGKDLSKIVKNQLREWQSVAFTRMAELRKKITSLFPSEESDILQGYLNLDRIIADEGYTQLRQFVATHLDELPAQQEYLRKIIVLTDSTQQMQGVLSLSIKSDHVFVNVLLSAPWNNSAMKSPLPSEYASLVKRGVGKTLMAEAYKIAQEFHKSRVELLPLGDSDSFYLHIGMEKKGPAYVFSVSDKIPQTLLTSGTSVVQITFP